MAGTRCDAKVLVDHVRKNWIYSDRAAEDWVRSSSGSTLCKGGYRKHCVSATVSMLDSWNWASIISASF